MKQILWSLLMSLMFLSCTEKEVSFEQKIDSQLRLFDFTDKPGIEVFVKKDTSLIYHKAFGESNIQTNKEFEINSVFNIASVSKEFTAIGILKLVEQGKLNLKDSIDKYVSGLPSTYRSITVENLLTHTSGIKRYSNLAWAENEANKQFSSTYDVIQYFKKDSLNFKPGEKHSYANMNYNILAHIIEQVSGQPYEQYLKENIFDPLDMDETFFPEDGQTIARSR